MANPPNDGQRIAANWVAVVKTKPEDQIHEDYWLFNQMKKGAGFKGISGGDSITSPIEYAENTTVQSYSDMDTFSTVRIDVFDRYEYDWKEVVGTAVISQIERDRNSGEGKLFDLLPAKLESLRKSMRSKINSMAFGDGTGNGGKDLTGLQALVATNPLVGSPGGINRANFSFWRNQQLSGAQGVSAFDNLRAAMRSIYNLSSNGVADAHPTFGVSTRTVFEGYESLLTANERFTSKAEGDGGFKNEVIKFKGMLLSYDNDCPAGNMYFLNPEYYKWVYVTGQWMRMLDEVRPANQTADIYAVRTAMNSIATQPRRLGVVTAIS